MTTTTNAPTPIDRIDAIAQSILKAVRPFAQAKEDQDTAQEAFQGAVSGKLNVREAIFAELAQLSTAGKWTESEITRAAKMACAASGGNNDKSKKSIATMVAEGKVAMHADVRTRVPGLIALRDLAWTEEMAGGKDDPKPFKDAFARAQHMLNRMMLATRDGARLATMDQIQDWVATLNPDLDPAKVFAKADAALSALLAVQKAMPTILVSRAIEALTGMTVEDFKAASAPAPSITTVGEGEATVNIFGEDTGDSGMDDADDDTTADVISEADPSLPAYMHDLDSLMSSAVL